MEEALLITTDGWFNDIYSDDLIRGEAWVGPCPDTSVKPYRAPLPSSSAPGRSAEEYVAQDWAAVAQAISQRMKELGINQRELIERSRVSKAAVGELCRNSVQRRRSARTLEALSIALGWHPQHLVAVLNGQRIPEVGEPVSRSDPIPRVARSVDLRRGC
jgi:hypothetical protein